jgi:hypothetical protein
MLTRTPGMIRMDLLNLIDTSILSGPLRLCSVATKAQSYSLRDEGSRSRRLPTDGRRVHVRGRYSLSLRLYPAIDLLAVIPHLSADLQPGWPAARATPLR